MYAMWNKARWATLKRSTYAHPLAATENINFRSVTLFSPPVRYSAVQYLLEKSAPDTCRLLPAKHVLLGLPLLGVLERFAVSPQIFYFIGEILLANPDF
jgi:hypothetical protein